ncbi:hypothetical protein OAK85_02270 [Mariniblastus sp.]|nr:hypothetical protein [Mariniblastus sp.]
MAIFSMLFGSGTVLMWQRSSQAGRKSMWLHYRRMFWLLLVGSLFICLAYVCIVMLFCRNGWLR